MVKKSKNSLIISLLPGLSNKAAAFRLLSVSLLLTIFAAGVVLFPTRFIQVSSSSAPQGKAPPDGIWQVIDPASLGGKKRADGSEPKSFQSYRLNALALTHLLRQAPMEFSEAAHRNQVILPLPMPDGTLKRFRIEESPVMEPGLAAKFPEVRMYRGQGVDDTTATTRFGWTPLGFHAVILSSQDAVYVDPYAPDDRANYISIYEEDLQENVPGAQCLVSESARLREGIAQQFHPSGPDVFVGRTLRKYRLAIGTTAQYTNDPFYGGSGASAKSATLTKLGIIVNLINAVYEREVAIHFDLIADQLSIIFDSEPDGYTNGNAAAMQNENPTVINTALPGGSASYDIGHAFGLTSPGSAAGVSNFGIACGPVNLKARATSILGIGLSSGNFIEDTKLVMHEIGHGFNATHTFNSSAGSCGGQRTPNSAYEPGSGSTIMSYAGLCAPETLQPLRDNYFHGVNVDQMWNYSVQNTPCATLVPTGNNPPAVDAGFDYVIPKSTPFTLTATASDPDGDSLTYCWEEYDVGFPSPPMTDSDGLKRPILRSFPAVTSPSRTFPRLSSILNNTSTIGESLPTIERRMDFTITVRDNRATGGVNNDFMRVDVSAASGPFVVSQPNTSVSWNGNTSQTVTWDVANTATAPVSCANVKISLSIDGGLTFPIILAASTPNDGSESIVVPDFSTSAARIKVEAVGNIFFDISNQNFTINAPCGFLTTPATQYFSARGGQGSVKVITTDSCGWSATSNDGWIVLTSSSSGSGNGDVTFEVRENFAGSTRQGSLTVGGQLITVVQNNNLTESCSYSITPLFSSFTTSGGSGTINVSASAGCAWKAESTASWIQITSGSAGIGNGTVSYTVEAGPNNVSRKGTMTIAGKTFLIKQTGS